MKGGMDEERGVKRGGVKKEGGARVLINRKSRQYRLKGGGMGGRVKGEGVSGEKGG